MKISFTGNTARDLHDKIASFCEEFGVSTEGSKQQTLPGTEATSSGGARTRRTKAQIAADEAAARAVITGPTAAPAATDFLGAAAAPTPAAAPTAPAAAVAAAPAAQPAITPAVVATPQQKTAVTEALTSVNSKFGLPYSKGLLLKFGCERLSSLDVMKYPEFLALVEKIKLAETLPQAQALLA